MSRTLDPSKAGTPQRDYPTMILFGLIVTSYDHRSTSCMPISTISRGSIGPCLFRYT